MRASQRKGKSVCERLAEAKERKEGKGRDDVAKAKGKGVQSKGVREREHGRKERSKGVYCSAAGNRKISKGDRIKHVE